MRSYRKSLDRKCCQSRDRKWCQSRDMSGNMFCACATGSWAISVLVGPFDRKWQSHVTGRGPVRMYVLRMPGFLPRFFISSSTMATGCDRRSLDTLQDSFRCAHAQPEVVQPMYWPMVTWPLRKCPSGVVYDVRGGGGGLFWCNND